MPLTLSLFKKSLNFFGKFFAENQIKAGENQKPAGRKRQKPKNHAQEYQNNSQNFTNKNFGHRAHININFPKIKEPRVKSKGSF
jgi:hypothetical protein